MKRNIHHPWKISKDFTGEGDVLRAPLQGWEQESRWDLTTKHLRGKRQTSASENTEHPQPGKTR